MKIQGHVTGMKADGASDRLSVALALETRVVGSSLFIISMPIEEAKQFFPGTLVCVTVEPVLPAKTTP